jgi:selenocysteine lyase/cysteine desulfurase
MNAHTAPTDVEHLLEHARADFPLLERTVNGNRLVYLDSTATSLKPNSVLKAMDHYYREVGANEKSWHILLAQAIRAK